jgi:hypothetical protein
MERGNLQRLDANRAHEPPAAREDALPPKTMLAAYLLALGEPTVPANAALRKEAGHCCPASCKGLRSVTYQTAR